jgi:hypothetical protein
MSLIKRVDVEKHFAARRAMRLGRTGPLSQTSARVQPVAAEKNAPASVKNGVTGYSSLNASVAPIPIAVDSDRVCVSTAPRNRQA